jgi:hypothetical protein
MAKVIYTLVALGFSGINVVAGKQVITDNQTWVFAIFMVAAGFALEA